MALSRRAISLGDLDIEYFEGGEGRPLLYLHDLLGLDPRMPALDRLTQRFHVIAPVNPGFGTTDPPMWLNSVDDFAHAHLALVRRLEIRDAVLVGASLGAWVAAEMATKSTHFLRHLVLVAPFGIKVGPVDRLDIPDLFAMPQAELDRRLFAKPETWRLDPATKSDAELECIARGQSTLALVGWEPYLHNPKLKHRLGTIDRPTLVLRGPHDGIVSEDLAASFSRLIPGARFEALADAAHLPLLEQADRTVARIVEFVG
ncbi:MAG TPA: alpha/beta hydrolase [Stellaceae bacterium]|nr:alpha/beta hydrolase [Stellaceae bacterium]